MSLDWQSVSGHQARGHFHNVVHEKTSLSILQYRSLQNLDAGALLYLDGCPVAC
jgi:hypothetical protein